MRMSRRRDRRTRLASSGQRVPQQQVLPSAEERQRQQWAAQNGGQGREEQRSPPQVRGHGQPPVQGGYQQSPPPAQDRYQQSPPHAQDPYAQPYAQQTRQTPPPQQARQAPALAPVRPPMPSIDTAQSRRAPAPGYMDHQPLSPASVPVRPNTANAHRSPTAIANHQHLQAGAGPSPAGSGVSWSHTPVGYHAGETQQLQPPAKVGQQQHAPQESLGDLYDGYHDIVGGGPDLASPDLEPPRQFGGRSVRDTRQIEEEMPDFDSAAPSQTSLLQKRAAEQARAAPAAQQQGDPYRHLAAQKQPVKVAAPAVGGSVAGAGFDFGVPQQQQAYQDWAYAQDAGYVDPYAPPVQPPQAPFATEPVARRSMDDARGMPYRGGPPPQQSGRAPVNGQQLPRGQYPPQQQQRPGMDERSMTGQTMQSVSSQGSRGQYLPQQQRPGMEDRSMTGQTMQSMNGQPPRGAAYSPPQRPPVDGRNLSSQTMQTVRSDMSGQSRGPAYPPQQRPGTAGRDMPAPVQPWADPGQRVPSAPPLRQGLQEPPSRQAVGVPLSQQRSAPEQEQHRHSNPDALPHHPVPVRPGLMEGGGMQQAAKPAPMRQQVAAPAPSHARQASTSQPVTHAELDHLRASTAAIPANNAQSLLLAKKLIEASTVLASESGRADPKTTARNREKYVLEAHKRIKKLAAAGYPDAQFFLADCYGQGSLGLEVDTKEAFNMYQAAAKQGHPQAAYRTAVCCEMGPEEGGGTRKDFAKAVQWYRRAAALGDVPAMFKLGSILLKGLLGQQRNVGESVIWLKRAAERADRENPHALHELGGLYESANTAPDVRGKLVQDDAYALELFTQAARFGYRASQFRLGQAYEYGALGLAIDHRASISWYSKAAAQGEHQAELALSGWYLTGADGILEQSDTEAYLWARKAAQSEPPLGKAMFAMGYFSEMGIGCPASVEEARRWYGRAAGKFVPSSLFALAWILWSCSLGNHGFLCCD